MKLFVFGLGYSALHLVTHHRERFGVVAGTTTDPAKAKRLAEVGIVARLFDSDVGAADPALIAEVAAADVILMSAPPPADAAAAQLVREAARTGLNAHAIAYLSTVGVYGDRAGGVVDFRTPAKPTGRRGQERLEAENIWRGLASELGLRSLMLRIAGIYGPGRNALRDVAAGRARRIIKPGQVFNRIHVDDIAGLLLAAIDRRDGDAVFDLADDEPAPPQDVIAFAATLLGAPPPPEIAFAATEMSPMAKSFWRECKHVANAATKASLDYTFVHPTYREGLAALRAAGEGATRAS